MADADLTLESAEQRSVLYKVLALNLGLSTALGIAGWLADSSALIANALDNLSDSVVYAISLYAVGRGAGSKVRAAQLSGGLLLVFAGLVLADALRRWLTGAAPIGPTMIVMALIAAGVNLLCLRLLRPLKRQDVNMRAAQTFSANDFISNAGIIVRRDTRRVDRYGLGLTSSSASPLPSSRRAGVLRSCATRGAPALPGGPGPLSAAACVCRCERRVPGPPRLSGKPTWTAKNAREASSPDRFAPEGAGSTSIEMVIDVGFPPGRRSSLSFRT